jgi:hypothetical protein
MNDKSFQVPDNIIDDAKHLINICSVEFEQPTDALFAAILVVAVIAKGAGMPLQTLLDGVSSAYSDLDPMTLEIGAKPHGTH